MSFFLASLSAIPPDAVVVGVTTVLVGLWFEAAVWDRRRHGS